MNRFCQGTELTLEEIFKTKKSKIIHPDQAMNININVNFFCDKPILQKYLSAKLWQVMTFTFGNWITFSSYWSSWTIISLKQLKLAPYIARNCSKVNYKHLILRIEKSIATAWWSINLIISMTKMLKRDYVGHTSSNPLNVIPGISLYLNALDFDTDASKKKKTLLIPNYPVQTSLPATQFLNVDKRIRGKDAFRGHKYSS